MSNKKPNTRGDLLLSPTWVRRTLYNHVLDYSKEKQITLTAVINECIEVHQSYIAGRKLQNENKGN